MLEYYLFMFFCRSSKKIQKTAFLTFAIASKGRGMIWEELRTPPKFGTKLPGPEGPGFLSSDKNNFRNI